MRSKSKNRAYEKPERRSIGFILTFVTLISCSLVSLLASLPATVVTANWESKSDVQRIYPQSWAFFTRDPKSPSLVLFNDAVGKGGRLQRADGLPQTLPENLFGLSREQRAADTEKAMYAEGAAVIWTDCRGLSTAQCYVANGKAEPSLVPAVTRGGKFCGVYRIAQTEPVKFAFRSESDQVYRITSMARIDVEC